MAFEYWLGLIVAVTVAVYMLYALLRPEKF